MCGIFGSISLGNPFSVQEIEKFENSLKVVSYRGPDDQSFKVFEGKRVFLGHRRLSIIDLSTDANQPMVSNGLWIVFNGEIFNYIELREELIKKGHSFKTNSDTEVILKVYQEYGPEGFSHFNGMWAFLLYDFNKNIFIASRDRFSIKPLYYLKQESRIYFASEIKQLLPLMPKREPNLNSLRILLAQQIQDHNEETFYQGIFKIPAKSNFIIDLNSGHQKTQQYWNYSKSSAYVSEKEALEKFVYLFEDSIKIRLRSDVQIGCLLSGGLDSTAISITADKINMNPVQTFSVISDDPKFSEEKFIDIAVKSAKLKNQKLSFKPQLAEQYIDKCLFHQDEPFGGASVVAQYMIYELIKNNTGIKVVLSGQGGDEVLMGYLKYFFFNIRQNLRTHNYGIVLREIFSSLIRRTAIMQFEWSLARRYLPQFQNHQKPIVSLPNEQMEKIWQFKDINHRQQLDLDRYSVPALTHFEDRNSMAHSIESRVPFLDHRLVDFLVNLNSDLKYKHGWSKYLLRNSSIALPEAIRWRRDKKGFSVPEKQWLYQSRDYTLNLKNYELMFQYGITNKSQLESRLKQYYSGSRFVNPKEIFSIYVANKWLTSNFKN